MTGQRRPSKTSVRGGEWNSSEEISARHGLEQKAKTLVKMKR